MDDPIILFTPALVVPDSVSVEGDSIIFSTAAAMMQFFEVGDVAAVQDFDGVENGNGLIESIDPDGDTATVRVKRLSCPTFP